MAKDKKLAKMLSQVAVEAIQEKIGKDVTLIDFDGVDGSLFDFYVICTANSPSHADALAQKVEEEVFKAMKIKPHRREGLRNCEWVLLDYFDVIIHIFLKDTRDFYNIESMWTDMKQTHYEDVN